jgi:hypothetical protein
MALIPRTNKDVLVDPILHDQAIAAERDGTADGTPAKADPAQDAPKVTYEERIAQLESDLQAKQQQLEAKEQFIGHQGNEIGAMRTLMQDLSDIKRNAELGTSPEDEPITQDELLNDPSSVIARTVKKELEEALAPLKDELAVGAQQRAIMQLNTDFPDWSQDVKSPEYTKWVGNKASRLERASRAAEGDLNEARSLLEDWSEMKEFMTAVGGDTTSDDPGQATPADKPQGLEGARAAVTESVTSGTPDVSVIEKIYRDDAVDLMLTDPDKYNSPAYQAKLRDAINNGKFIT